MTGAMLRSGKRSSAAPHPTVAAWCGGSSGWNRRSGCGGTADVAMFGRSCRPIRAGSLLRAVGVFSRVRVLFCACAAMAACSQGVAAEQPGGMREFVRVSPRDARYFELTDGSPYIPIGFNLVGPPGAEDLDRVVNTMGDHGVNYCRIWLDQPLWSVEHARSGEYDAGEGQTAGPFLALCRFARHPREDVHRMVSDRSSPNRPSHPRKVRFPSRSTMSPTAGSIRT